MNKWNIFPDPAWNPSIPDWFGWGKISKLISFHLPLSQVAQFFPVFLTRRISTMGTAGMSHWTHPGIPGSQGQRFGFGTRNLVLLPDPLG